MAFTGAGAFLSGLAGGLDAARDADPLYNRELEAQALMDFQNSNLGQQYAAHQIQQTALKKAAENKISRGLEIERVNTHPFFRDTPELQSAINDYFSTKSIFEVQRFSKQVDSRKFSGFIKVDPDLDFASSKQVRQGGMQRLDSNPDSTGYNWWYHDPDSIPAKVSLANRKFGMYTHQGRKEQDIAPDAETPQDIFTTAFSKLTPDEQYHYTKQKTNFGDAVNAFIQDQEGSLIGLDKDFRRTLQRYNRELTMAVSEEEKNNARLKIGIAKQTWEAAKAEGFGYTTLQYQEALKHIIAPHTAELGLTDTKRMTAFMTDFFMEEKNKKRLHNRLIRLHGVPNMAKGRSPRRDASTIDTSTLKTHFE